MKSNARGEKEWEVEWFFKMVIGPDNLLLSSCCNNMDEGSFFLLLLISSSFPGIRLFIFQMISHLWLINLSIERRKRNYGMSQNWRSEAAGSLKRLRWNFRKTHIKDPLKLDLCLHDEYCFFKIFDTRCLNFGLISQQDAQLSLFVECIDTKQFYIGRFSFFPSPPYTRGEKRFGKNWDWTQALLLWKQLL